LHILGFQLILENISQTLLISVDSLKKGKADLLISSRQSYVWLFLDYPSIVHTKPFETALLLLHLYFLLHFLFAKWTTSFFKDIRLWPLTTEKKVVSPYFATLVLSTCNLIGMTFARGIHG